MDITKGEFTPITEKSHYFGNNFGAVSTIDKKQTIAIVYGNTKEEIQGNSELIADALNTHNATGYKPSELKQQKDELLEALEKCIIRIEFMEQYTEGSLDPYSKKREFRELITKYSNNENT